MSKYTTQSEATRTLAAQQIHNDMHPGHGVTTMPTHEQIARCAYDIYVDTGCKPGQCTQNWYKAEQSLRDHDKAIRHATCQGQKRNSGTSAHVVSVQ